MIYVNKIHRLRFNEQKERKQDKMVFTHLKELNLHSVNCYCVSKLSNWLKKDIFYLFIFSFLFLFFPLQILVYCINVYFYQLLLSEGPYYDKMYCLLEQLQYFVLFLYL